MVRLNCSLISVFTFRPLPDTRLASAPRALLHFTTSPQTRLVDMVGISALVESDAEDQQSSDEISQLSTSSDTRIQNPTKKRKRRCVTMPKAKSRVTKALEAKKPAKKATAAKSKAVEEQIEEDDEIQETQAPTPKPRGRAAKKVAPEPIKVEADETLEETTEAEPSPAMARSSHAQSRKAVPKPVAKTASRAAPKKQAQLEMDDDMQIDEPVRNHSTQHTSYRRRAGSASDTERGDPSLRRKLGDITRKYENIELKYRNLKDAGVAEANANFEKLRKQCDANTKASNELVASLKQELSQQGPLVQDGRKLKRQVQTSEQELAEIRKANSTLSASLSSAQNEIKNLQAKLAAVRGSSAAVEKVPGSAMKHAAARGDSQSAQMKEELYRDLTGLIVRSVTRSAEGETYDCIQTGRNGSKSRSSCEICANQT